MPKYAVLLILAITGCSSGANNSKGDAPDIGTEDMRGQDTGEDSSGGTHDGGNDTGEPDVTDPIDVADLGPPLNVIGWNLESGDSDVELLAEYVEEQSEAHIWGFSEVTSPYIIPLEIAASQGGRNFQRVVGMTGRSDRLLILFDRDRLEVIGVEELEEVNVSGTVRAPIVAELRDLETDKTFKFMVNHLYRSSASGRHEQARQLNSWVTEQDLPVIAAGDYNFDWDVVDGEDDHDLGYDLMIENDAWTWLRPDRLVRTQCGSSFNGVLDFIFVNDAAKAWNGVSTIAENSPSFCDFGAIGTRSTDDSRMSDHKPIHGVFYPAAN